MKDFYFISHITKWLLCIAATIFFISCGNDKSTAPPDTKESGTIHISADESFKPVIDAQIAVYESSYPDTHIIPHYKPEAECLKDFLVDSIRMIIATRGFSETEEQIIMDSLKVDPSKMVIAFDAVAVIVNKEAQDSLFSMDEIKEMLLAKGNNKFIPVFDGVNATSTVRFIIDSVLGGQSLGTNVTAAKSSEGVIDYVSKTKNAVGFIGVSWIGNNDDSTQLTYLDKIKVAQLESRNKREPGVYVTPAQYNIYYNRYPMVRKLIYTLKEKHIGLAHGFSYFLTGQRGQLLFKRSYLMPAQMSFNIRNASLHE